MSGSASCTVFMPGTGGAGKCSENKQFSNCKNYSREKDRKKTQTKKKLTPEQQREKELKKVYKMKIQSNQIKGWPKGPGTYGESGIVMDAGTGAILYAKTLTHTNIRRVLQRC